MKYLILLAFTLIGCATRDYTQLTDQVGEYGVQKIKDKKENVVCYVYRDGDNSSLSCVNTSR